MEFLPQPHHVEKQAGVFRLTTSTQIVMCQQSDIRLHHARLLQSDIRRQTGLEVGILRGHSEAGDILLQVRPDLPADHHVLSITPDGIQVWGGSDEAVLHGVLTLGQWIHRHGAAVPCLLVKDHPDLPNRGYYQDISRGRIPTLQSLKDMADWLCRARINEWQLYVEHTYLFRHESEAWREDTPLTAQEIMELDAYCQDRCIRLVPSISSFGHMYMLLSTKTHAHLCELPDSEKHFSYNYFDEMRHHTVNVSHPDSMDFVKQLILEYMPLFKSRTINICCDETFDLGKGRSSALAAEKGGSHQLYVDYVSQMCQWLLDMGYTPQIWGDILVHDPASYAAIPQGTVCLNWGYAPDQREEDMKCLAEMGAVQYACPGVGTWNQLIPLFQDSFQNIRLMCGYAHKYKAIGLLNTDWGDFGHVCNPWFSLPGILYGAAFSWHSEAISFDAVNRAISFLFYGDRTEQFMDAWAKLSDQAVFSWYHAVGYLQEDQPDQVERLRKARQEKVTAAAAQEKAAAIQQGLDELDRALLNVDAGMRAVGQSIHLAAEGVDIWNRIGVFITAVLDQGKPAQGGETLAADLEYWFRRYMIDWRKASQASHSHNLLKFVCQYADLLRGRE